MHSLFHRGCNPAFMSNLTSPPTLCSLHLLFAQKRMSPTVQCLSFPLCSLPSWPTALMWLAAFAEYVPSGLLVDLHAPNFFSRRSRLSCSRHTTMSHERHMLAGWHPHVGAPAIFFLTPTHPQLLSSLTEWARRPTFHPCREFCLSPHSLLWPHPGTRASPSLHVTEVCAPTLRRDYFQGWPNAAR